MAEPVMTEAERVAVLEKLSRENPHVLQEALKRFLADYDEKIHPLVEAEVNGSRN